MTPFEIVVVTIVLWWGTHCLEARSRKRIHSAHWRALAQQHQKGLSPPPVEESCLLTEHIYEAARAEGLDPDWEMRNMGQGAVDTMIAKGVLACSTCKEPVFPEDSFCTGCGGRVRGKGKAKNDGQLSYPLL